MNLKNTLLIGGLVAVSLAGIWGCTNQDSAMTQAELHAERRPNIYVMKNDVEFNNYNRRQVLADDPTSILWCTSAFPVPGSPMFTIPIVGKLTSGSKRPFPISDARPGPDGMYGSSGEYRYGFTTSGMYADWYNMQTFCTTEPTVWQRQSTTLVMQADPELLRVQTAARAALARGNTAEANRILSAGIAAAH